jgi:hypothetical protein
MFTDGISVVFYQREEQTYRVKKEEYWDDLSYHE